jgi:hypothetical protein
MVPASDPDAAPQSTQFMVSDRYGPWWGMKARWLA